MSTTGCSVLVDLYVDHEDVVPARDVLEEARTGQPLSFGDGVRPALIEDLREEVLDWLVSVRQRI